MSGILCTQTDKHLNIKTRTVFIAKHIDILQHATFLSGHKSLNHSISANCLRNVGTSGEGSRGGGGGGGGGGVGVLGRGGVGVLGFGCSTGFMISATGYRSQTEIRAASLVMCFFSFSVKKGDTHTSSVFLTRTGFFTMTGFGVTFSTGGDGTSVGVFGGFLFCSCTVGSMTYSMTGNKRRHLTLF